MSTVTEARTGGAAVIAALDRALGDLMRPVANLVAAPAAPRRRAHRAPARAADRSDRGSSPSCSPPSSTVSSSAASSAGLATASLVVVGFGIENVEITGHKETSELAVLEKLDLDRSLVFFDVADAQRRLAALPWIERTRCGNSIRHAGRAGRGADALRAVAARRGGLRHGPDGHRSCRSTSRVTRAALHGGRRRERTAPPFLAELEQPDIPRECIAVLVAGRRWDLHLDDGVTIKLPEKKRAAALAQLVRLDSEKHLLARDVDRRRPAAARSRRRCVCQKAARSTTWFRTAGTPSKVRRVREGKKTKSQGWRVTGEAARPAAFDDRQRARRRLDQGLLPDRAAEAA